MVLLGIARDSQRMNLGNAQHVLESVGLRSMDIPSRKNSWKPYDPVKRAVVLEGIGLGFDVSLKWERIERFRQRQETQLPSMLIPVLTPAFTGYSYHKRVILRYQRLHNILISCPKPKPRTLSRTPFRSL